MTTKLDFLRTIVTHPHEDTPRNLFADWLDENGEPERAEFIRVQIELHNGPDGIGKAIDLDDQGERLAWCDKVQELSRRERELLGQAFNWLRISRGFISSITCSWEDFLKHADKLLWWEKRPCPRADYQEDYKTCCSACDGQGVIPGATMECQQCRVGHFAEVNNQSRCQCKGSGRIPRPCPETVQPITTVTLTTWPDERFVAGGRIRTEEWLRKQWPSIETWNLPPSAPVPQ